MKMQAQATQSPRFVIEATSHCRNGKLPRWTFLVQGRDMDGHMRHGMVGTDVQGRGLYLYGAARDHSSSGTQLIAPENLHLPDTFSRQQANADVISMLEKVDWNIPRQALTQPRPCAERRAVA